MRVVQLAGLGDDALLATVLNKHNGSTHLRSHRAFGKLALLKVLLGLGDGDSVKSLLVLLTEIDVDLRHIGEDVELIGTDLDSAEGAGKVFVDDSLYARHTVALFDNGNAAAADSHNHIALFGQLLNDLDIVDTHRFRRSHNLAPAVALGVFLVRGTRLGGKLLSLFLSVVRSDRLGRVLEHRVKLIDSHLSHQRHNVALNVVAGHHVAQSHLNHIGYRALSLSHAEIHRHSFYALGAACLVLQHNVAHLRTVAVADNHVIVAFQQVAQTFASLLHIVKLFFICTLLTATQQCVSAKSDYCEFLHLLLIYFLFNKLTFSSRHERECKYTDFARYGKIMFK